MSTPIIIALIVVGIALLLFGAWLLGKGYLRSLFSTPEPVKARRVYPRAACPFCGKSYAVREGWPITFIHHDEGRCAANHVGIAPGAGFVPSEEVDGPSPIPDADKE